MDVLLLLLHLGPGPLDLTLGNSWHVAEEDGAHLAFLALLLCSEVFLEVLLVVLLNRLALLVEAAQLPLQFLGGSLHFLQESLAWNLDLAVQVFSEFEGMASPLLVFYLEGR